MLRLKGTKPNFKKYSKSLLFSILKEPKLYKELKSEFEHINPRRLYNDLNFYVESGKLINDGGFYVQADSILQGIGQNGRAL